jgi:cytochrome o ubiquinol oxidase subunit I
MNWQELIFGKLTWAAAPHEWFTIGGTWFFAIAGVTVVLFITKLKRWKWLWNEWFTSVDPKRIGIMYLIVATFMLGRGGLDAIMIWLQQALAASNMPGFIESQHGYLSAHHLQQVMTAHGNIMVFFFAMGFLFGLINLIVPLQIGARDLAYPFLNTLGFWLYVAGVVMVNMFFFVGGEFAATGWLAIAPLSESQFSPGVGVDYWIWSLQISGLGTLIGGINFFVTIIKMRAPGMSLMRMPLFVWGSLVSMVLIMSVFPVLTATIAMLFLDRYFDMHFFTTDMGGNAMMYTNLIWMWGHPEVYILILPGFGALSEIVSTFSQKRLSGYVSLVIALMGISSLALLVWLHHFFTMGAGANVNAFFGIMTMVIAIPTGIQIINWIRTMYKGRIRFYSPMLWFLGFVFTFTMGGMAGLLLASPPVDFQVHNSLFLVAHFHTTVVGGAIFSIFAAFTYWFPKIAGFKLHETLGKAAFWLWQIGFIVSFTPLYILGFMGATRRLDHYAAETGWQPLFIVAFLGSLIIALAVCVQIFQVAFSVWKRRQLRDTTGDPWNGRTLEWSTRSPAPFYNFAIIPEIKSREPWWDMKKQKEHHKPKYQDIIMPKNTAMGIYVSAFVFLAGFGFVWHMHWLAIVGIVGAVACAFIRGFNEEPEYVLKAKDVEKYEKDPSTMPDKYKLWR